MSTLVVTNISDGATAVPATVVTEGGIKCQYAFNQVSITLIDSYNISSITDRATGSSYGNWTNAMANTNGALAGAASPEGIGGMLTSSSNRALIGSADTTARLSVNLFQCTTGSPLDEDYMGVMYAGDLA